MVSDKSVTQKNLFGKNINDNSVHYHYNGITREDLEYICQSVAGETADRVKSVVPDMEKLISIIYSNVIEYIHKEGQVTSNESIKKNFEDLKKDISGFSNDLVKKISENADRIEMYCKSMQHYAEEIYYLFCKSSLDRASFNKEQEFGVAKQCLRDADFDGAKELFEKATQDEKYKARAYFYLALASCKVQLIWDCKKQKEQPICYDNGNDIEATHYFKMAMECETSDDQKNVYKELASDIKKVKQAFKKFENLKTECDCFVCVKVSEPNTDGDTDDSKWLNDNYELLKRQLGNGVKLFYSEKDCQEYDAGSLEYGALIAYALSRAKCMLLVCSNESYLDTPWVKNEYTRFRRALKARNLDEGQIIIVFNGKVVNLSGRGEFEDKNRGKITETNKQEWFQTLANDIITKIEIGKYYVQRNFKYCPLCNNMFGSSQTHCPQCKRDGKYIVPLLDAHDYLNEKNKKIMRQLVKAQEQIKNYEDKVNNLSNMVKSQEDELTREKCELEKKTIVLNDELNESKQICKDLNKELSELQNGGAVVNISNIIGEFDIVNTVLVKYRGSRRNVVIPEGITAIGDTAFNNCNSIITIEIPSTITSVVGEAFVGCDNLETIIVSRKNKKYKSENNCIIEKRVKKLIVGCKSSTIPDYIIGIESYAFSGRASLMNTSLPTGLLDIGLEAYSGCDKSLCKKYDNALYIGNSENPHLLLVQALNKDITSCKVHEDTEIIHSYAFKDCNSLTNIEISSNLNYIFYSSFQGCTNIATANIPSFCISCIDKSNLKKITINSGYEISDSEFYKCCLESVKISKSIKIIGENAFRDSNLRKIEIENNSQLEVIGNYAFYNSKIQNIKVSRSVKSIGEEAFGYYDYYRDHGYLTDLQFEEGSNLITIGQRAFSHSDLKSIKIPSGVTKIGDGAFESSNVTNVKFECESQLEIIGDDAFSNNKIESIEIPRNVRRIGKNAFRNCNLEKIEFEKESQLEIIGSGAFYNANIESIIIPNSVKHIAGDAFGCNYWYSHSKLKHIRFEEGSHLISIGQRAFYNSDIRSIKIPSSVTKIGSYSFKSSNLEYVEFESNSQLEVIGNGAFRDNQIKSIEIPDKVISIGDYAFSKCGALTDVQLPSNLISIGDKSFFGSDNIKIATIPTIAISCIPNSSIEQLTINGGDRINDKSFYQCNNLESVKIVGNLKSIGGLAFAYCSKLNNIELSNSITSIGSSAFYNCKNLSKIVIPSSVKEIGSDAFAYCSRLVIYCETASQPSGWYNNWNNKCEWPVIWNSEKMVDYDKSEFEIEDSILKKYKGTKSKVIIPNCVTIIDHLAFYNNNNLTGVLLPNNLKEIGQFAFYGCKNLQDIVLPDSLTNIGKAAFSYCVGMTSIFIPRSVASIGSAAFGGCNELKIFCETNNKPSGWDNLWKSEKSRVSWNSSKNHIIY